MAHSEGDVFKTPAFQFYPEDFIADTSDFTAEEVGIYLRLLCRAWKKGGIPVTNTLRARIGQVPVKRMEEAWEIIGSRFKPHSTDATLLIQRRLERVRADALAFHKRQVENGRRGGRPRNTQYEANILPDQTREKPMGFSGETQTESQGEPKKSPPPPSPISSLPDGREDARRPAQAFALWFLKSAIASNVMDEILDPKLWVRRNFVTSQELLATYGEDACKARALAMFRAITAGCKSLSPTLASLLKGWDYREVREEMGRMVPPAEDDFIQQLREDERRAEEKFAERRRQREVV